MKVSTAVLVILSLTYGRVYPSTDMCYPKNYFRFGRLFGNVLRRLESVGPFTCVRECLLRSSCLSINYNFQNLTCDLNYAKAYQNGHNLTTDGDFQYLDRRRMHGLIDTAPCTDTTCGEYERCEILANKKVICSKPECRPHVNQKNIQSVNIFSNTTLAVGEHVHYYCDVMSNLQVTYRCQQDGTWKITDDSDKKCECQVRGFTYSELSNGCYMLVYKNKSHDGARIYCMSTFEGSHLFLADSNRKIDAVKSNLPKLYQLSNILVWIDGTFNKSTGEMVTSQGPRPVEEFQKLAEYVNVDYQSDGCLMFSVFSVLSIHINNTCTGEHHFICELN